MTGKGCRFAGSSCSPAAHDALLSGGVALAALLVWGERSRAGGVSAWLRNAQFEAVRRNGQYAP